MNEISDRFKANILDKNLFTENSSLLLSMSAGKDSMFMFCNIMSLVKEMRLRIGVFHLNHLLRGEESDGDEEFLKSFLMDYQVETYFREYDFNACADHRKSFEEHARTVRYSMLDSIKSEFNYDLILTAHNKNDNAETVFMRILKGTGLRGLEGIPESEGSLVRPVLPFDVEEIYSFLRNNSLKWREDSSNLSDKYERNFIRNSVFPLIGSRFSGFLDNITGLMEHSRENRLLMERFIDERFGHCVYSEGDSHFVDIECLNDDIPVTKFIISKILRNNYDTVLSHSVFREIFRKIYSKRSNILLYSNGTVSINKGYHKGKAVISLSMYNSDEIPDEWEYAIPEGDGEICIKESDMVIYFRRFSCVAEIPAEYKDFIGIGDLPSASKVMVRSRRPGDRIIIKNGRKKIKDLMIEKKLDSVAKKKVPLITVNNEVAVYLPLPDSGDNFRISKKYLIDSDSKNIILFTLKQGM